MSYTNLKKLRLFLSRLTPNLRPYLGIGKDAIFLTRNRFAEKYQNGINLTMNCYLTSTFNRGIDKLQLIVATAREQLEGGKRANNPLNIY